MTTELQVRTITFEPAKVEFNFDQLTGILDANLVKYQGLEFTEKTAGDCKKTIAELRKGKTLLDTYRKDTKKQLTESVSAFENQCKELAAKFDGVITPLSEQYDQFEFNRKERKRAEIQGLIDSLIVQEGLDAKRAAQMIIPDDYLNKGKSAKDIKVELTSLAKSLGIVQDKEAADIQIIQTNVELANAKHQLQVGLVDSAYIQLLEHNPIAQVIDQISADAAAIKQRELEAEHRRQYSVPKAAPAAVNSRPALLNEDEPIYVETFVIEGTESQLQALEEFLETEEITFKVTQSVSK